SGAGVKDERIMLVIKATDFQPLLVFAGIPSRYHHYRSGMMVIYLQFSIIQVAGRCRKEQVEKIRLDPGQHRLGLRITHSHVILYYIRFPSDVHQSNEYKAFERNGFSFQTVNSWPHDPVLNLFHEGLVGKDYRRHRPHPAGVQARVAFPNAFVVLCFWQHHIVLPVRQYENRQFYTVKEFFNQHFGTRLSEFPVDEHLSQFLTRLTLADADDYAFARRKSVCL